MKSITVKEKMGYVFEVVVSGLGVNGVHGKVKFLDEKGKEVGVDYVSAPRFTETFDLIKFSGNFITPKGAKTILFELNSHEKPQGKTYWWIHDMKLKELAEETKPNVAKSKYDFKKPGRYAIFVRTFQNMHGGRIRVGME